MSSREQAAPDPAAADLDRYDFGARERSLPGWLRHVAAWLCIGFSLFHFLALNALSIDEWIFRATHVALALVIGFILYCAWSGERGRTAPLIDAIAIVASVACAAYIAWQVDGLALRSGVLPTAADTLIAVAGTVLVLEMARRTAGLALPIICGVFIAYVFAGPFLPGVLRHQGFDAASFFTFIHSTDGIHGLTTSASSQFIVIFVVFAAFLNVSRVGDYFMDLSIALVGGARGGPAKVAVVSGILFGTVSGSAVANVVASGTFTIPSMRRVGYSRDSAAAIEATSSTGGQLTPPVMGAAAFLMAEITNIPYGEIALAAVIPAILFYWANYIHVDIEAIKQGIRGLPKDELPALRPMLGRSLMLHPLITLLAFIAGGFSIIAAGTWGTVAAAQVILLNRLGLHSVWLAPATIATIVLVQLDWPATWVGGAGVSLGLVSSALGWVVSAGRTEPGRALLLFGRDVMEALRQGAVLSVQLVAVCAAAGIIVGVLGLTGLGGRFSSMILSIAGSSLFLALLFTMVITVVLGMGMPTTAAYAIAAAVVAPGLRLLGIDAMSAHMFVFYFAVVSAITPPVALASFAATALARSDPWKTSLLAVRYGVAAFLVPFLFVYHPELLGRGEWLAIAYVGLIACAAIGFLALASEGWCARDLPLIARLVLAAASFAMLSISTRAVVAGSLAGMAVCGWAYLARRAGKHPALGRET